MSGLDWATKVSLEDVVGPQVIFVNMAEQHCEILQSEITEFKVQSPIIS